MKELKYYLKFPNIWLCMHIRLCVSALSRVCVHFGVRGRMEYLVNLLEQFMGLFVVVITSTNSLKYNSVV
jgi:hypothetical protein